MFSLKKTGAQGEELVVEYLKKNNYLIIERNRRLGHLEVDIIARDLLDSKIVFLEVKTRNIKKKDQENDLFFKKNQINRLKRAMEIYALRQQINLELLRLDYVEVFLDQNKKTAKLKHFKNILN